MDMNIIKVYADYIEEKTEFKDMDSSLKRNIIESVVKDCFTLLDEIQSINSMGIVFDTAKPEDLRKIGDQSVKETFKELYLKKENYEKCKDINTKYLYKTTYRLIKEVELNCPKSVIDNEIKLLSIWSLRCAGYLKDEIEKENTEVNLDEDRC